MENYGRNISTRENDGMNMESICRELPNAIACVEGAAHSCKKEFEQKMYNRTISSLRILLEPCNITDGPLTTALSTSDSAVCTLHDLYTCVTNLSQMNHQTVYQDACRAYTDAIVCSSRLNKLCADVLFIEEQIHYILNQLNASILVYFCTDEFNT
ncbi:uncharacterized protein LOC131929321, partial [Physella acuta]|uniref:uncharacterized protein LOC131929321 n=1 Tax=Physella acuta TaxID=109671 RepID=UPI0027DAF79A